MADHDPITADEREQWRNQAESFAMAYPGNCDDHDYDRILRLLNALDRVEKLADDIDQHDYTKDCAEDRCRDCLTAEAVRAAISDRRYRPGSPSGHPVTEYGTTRCPRNSGIAAHIDDEDGSCSSCGERVR